MGNGQNSNPFGASFGGLDPAALQANIAATYPQNPGLGDAIQYGIIGARQRMDQMDLYTDRRNAFVSEAVRQLGMIGSDEANELGAALAANPEAVNEVIEMRGGWQNVVSQLERRRPDAVAARQQALSHFPAATRDAMNALSEAGQGGKVLEVLGGERTLGAGLDEKQRDRDFRKQESALDRELTRDESALSRRHETDLQGTRLQAERQNRLEILDREIAAEQERLSQQLEAAASEGALDRAAQERIAEQRSARQLKAAELRNSIKNNLTAGQQRTNEEIAFNRESVMRLVMEQGDVYTPKRMREILGKADMDLEQAFALMAAVQSGDEAAKEKILAGMSNSEEGFIRAALTIAKRRKHGDDTEYEAWNNRVFGSVGDQKLTVQGLDWLAKHPNLAPQGAE